MAQQAARQAIDLVRLAAHVGHGVQRLATDAALQGVRRFPRRVADLDAETLSRIMGRRVSSVSVIERAAGTSSRARLALTGDDVPRSIFVKTSAGSAANRMLGELARLGETEARFYKELAPELGAGVPRTYGSAWDPVTGRYVVVLEDMATTPCRFPDTLHPLDNDQMALLVEVLARLHGTFWGRLPEKPGGGGQFGWLWPPASDPSVPLTPYLMKMSARRLVDRTSIPVEAGRFIWENFRAVTALVDAGPHTVLHGDSHPGNTFFRNGQAGLLDWQVVRRGHQARDLTYTLVLGMTTADRRAGQGDLLQVYRRALVGAGGPDVDADELWSRYRQAVVYAYVSPLATAGLGGMQTEEIALEGLRRAVAALDDLETVDALKRSV
jgi:aminoglycoside phosphotransferase (APT) family kinase protein